MRYYRFNRKTIDPIRKQRISSRKLRYLAERNKLRLLDSSFSENETWGALHKAWKGYVIAKNKYEPERMEYYVEVIQKLQCELGFKPSPFPETRVDQLRDMRNDALHANNDITEEDVDDFLQQRLEKFRKEIQNNNEC